MFHKGEACFRRHNKVAGMTNQFKTSLESRRTILAREHGFDKFPF